MALKKASFGIVALLVTMAIVLLLVAKRWQSLSSGSRQAEALAETGVPSDGLSGIHEAEVLTDAHASEVSGALEATQD